MSKVAVVLSGCGFLDGSEIHESVLCLLALSQARLSYQCFAPDKEQADVINHLSKEPSSEDRNALVEAARIARGEIVALNKLKVEDYEALLVPGGFGAAKTLSSFASEGSHCQVLPEFSKVLHDFYTAKKPIGLTCIAPAACAKALEGEKLTLTLGSSDANHSLEEMGMEAKSCRVNEVAQDKTHKIYSTPAYMEPADLAGMFEGISKLVACISQDLKVSS